MESDSFKILAIDDNRDNLITLKALISETFPKADFYFAESGLIGVESVRLNKPDIILLDIVMPQMNGYEVCKILKSDKSVAETPVIFITAIKDDRESRIRALDAGGDGFLAKPIDQSELIAQIRAMLKISEASKFKRSEKVLLEKLVDRRTSQLNSAHLATLNLLEDLKEENEIRKNSEEALLDSEKRYSFLTKSASDLVQCNSIIQIYRYTTRKLREILADSSIVVMFEYDITKNRWKLYHIEGIKEKFDELNGIFGFNVMELEEELSSLFIDKILTEKITELEFDFPGFTNNKYSNETGEKIRELLPFKKLYRIAFKQSSEIAANIALLSEQKLDDLKLSLIEAFVYQVSSFVNKLKAEEEVRSNYELLKIAGDTAKFGGWSVDPKGKFKWPEATAEIFEAKNRIAPSLKEFFSYFTPDSAPIITKAYNNCLNKGASFDLELQIFLNNSLLKWVRATGKALKDRNGKAVNVIGSIQDINEKKIAEINLLAAKEKAEESDRLKTAFLNNISHEIRTPLNGILGFGEIAANASTTPEKLEEALKYLNLSGNRLLNTVNDYIDMAGIVSGALKSQMEIFLIMPFFEKTVAEIKNSYNNPEIEFLLSLPPNSSSTIICSDSKLIKRVLNILIDNAFKFTLGGTITCGFELDGKFAKFFVKDTGNGIPADKLKTIFNLFSQVDSSLTSGFEGSGLGLTIAEGVAKLLEGELHVTSEVGKGSIFTFKIPVNPRDCIDSDIVAQTPKTEILPSPLILFAEDDESNYHYMEELLEINGYKYLHALNGAEAVEICRNNSDISIVLMDIKMPVMNGVEATRLIRQFRPELPIIATTAFAQIGDEQRFLDAGCSGYISKPLTQTKLLEVIKKYSAPH